MHFCRLHMLLKPLDSQIDGRHEYQGISGSSSWTNSRNKNIIEMSLSERELYMCIIGRSDRTSETHKRFIIQRISFNCCIWKKRQFADNVNLPNSLIFFLFPMSFQTRGRALRTKRIFHKLGKGASNQYMHVAQSEYYSKLKFAECASD